MDHQFLFTIFARLNPAIWDVINQAGLAGGHVAGPVRTDSRLRSELNPQPLPPLAPESVGALVGVELARLSWSADKLGTKVSPVADWDDNPCGTVPFKLHLPWWVPIPVPDPEPEPWWVAGYYVGLASALAVAHASTRSEFLADALGQTVASLGRLETERQLPAGIPA